MPAPHLAVGIPASCSLIIPIIWASVNLLFRELLHQIKAKGAGLVILSLGSETIDTSTATGKRILNMMVSVAQFEREMMKERQVEGIKRAKAEGKYKGRVPTAMRQADKVKALVEAGVARVLVMEQLGISKASYYRCLQNAA